MSKRFIPVLLALILGGLFITYGVMGGSDRNPDNPKAKFQRILRNVGIVLEQGHYSPKPIDDQFSAEVLDNYIKSLDPDKITFLQKDIDAFNKKYAHRIDDEIHGSPLQSFYAISDVYDRRLDELDSMYRLALKRPIDFTINESLQTDGDKRKYPANDKERYDYARKRMKYQVLIRYVDLQERQDSTSEQTTDQDGTLKKEAVEKADKQTQRYFETLKNHNTPEEMFSVFVNAITGTMDPHTTYMAPIDKRTFDEMLSGTFYGIGAQLREVDGQIKIMSLITGMPAWKSGEIKPEDIILKVGEGDEAPVDVTGYALSDAVKLIRGRERGSVVKLTLKKTDGTVKVVALKRDKISLDETFAKSAVIKGSHKVGYIRLPEFYANFENPDGRRSATDVEKEVKKLMAAHVNGIVIDLRGNGGGSLSDVVDIVGLFIKDGPVVQVKGRGEDAVVLKSRSREPLYTGPLAVMVDEMSASASEIFAAAIQDYHRGIIIGSSSTYGKGTVQRNISLDPRAQNSLFLRPSDGLGDIKLTFRKFYRINGGATQLRGVVPDIIIPDRYENAKFRERDNPDALGWDTIPKVHYAKWNPGYNFQNIVKHAELEIHQNKNFQGIKNVVNGLDKYREEEVPLQINRYKEIQSKIRQLSGNLENDSEASHPLQVNVLDVDDVSGSKDSVKVAIQKLFVNGIANDIYIAETISILDQVVGIEQIAKIKQNQVAAEKAEESYK